MKVNFRQATLSSSNTYFDNTHFNFNTYSKFNFALLLVPSRFAKGFV